MGWDVGGTQRLVVGVATLAAAASAWWLYAGTHPLEFSRNPSVAETAGWGEKLACGGPCYTTTRRGGVDAAAWACGSRSRPHGAACSGGGAGGEAGERRGAVDEHCARGGGSSRGEHVRLGCTRGARGPTRGRARRFSTSTRGGWVLRVVRQRVASVAVWSLAGDHARGRAP